ncbi:MAG: penicillin-binding protein activator [Bacteroidales bacterium]|nr:penicillin-binding protein activator [Bacteroidales bacterium]
MKKILFYVLVLVGFAIAFSCGNREKGEEKEVIKIGAILPLTGQISFIGENFQHGIILANKNSDNKYIQFKFHDHSNQPKQAVSIFKQLHDRKNNPIVITTITSSTNAILPLNTSPPNILLGSILSGSDITQKSNYLFRYFLSTRDEVDKIINYFKQRAIDNVGVFYINDDYGLDAMQYFKKNFDNNLDFVQPYEVNTTDFKNYIPKAFSSNNLYILGYGQNYGTFIKQLREFGFKGEIFCFSSFGTPVSLQQAGQASNGIVFTGSNFYKNKNEREIEEFTKEYEKSFQKEPDHYSLYGYDVANVCIKAIRNIKGNELAISPENIKKEILSWKKFEGLLGKSLIDSTGDFRFEVHLYEVGDDFKVSPINY